MKGLYELLTDDATYCNERLYFVINDHDLESDKFFNKLKDMFPDINDLQILSMTIDNERIKVYDDTGYSHVIFIDNIETLDTY